MKKYLLLPFYFLVNLCIQAQSTDYYRNPVIPGDVPDPTVIRVGEDYYAAATTSDFAPNYPLFHSRDLVNWEQIGSVFHEPPGWIKGDCWAPELFYHNDTFFVYYTARKRSDNISCIGIATTTDLRKGFQDYGPLIEWGSEAIDAYIFREDDGTLYISWKAYGLDERPIEILCSELSQDGLSLVGEYFTLTHHDKGWKGYGDEGQCIIKRNGYYYHFYSVGGCCDRRCDYSVEVARARDLRGDWEQYSGNPILEGGEIWRCSGHGTLVQTPDDRYFYLYHAYHIYGFDFTGRQGLLDELVWNDETGWPYFKAGKNPSLQAPMPFAGTKQERLKEFYDNFTSSENDKYWFRDMNLPEPVVNKNNGVLSLSAKEKGIVFRGINPKSPLYTMECGVKNSGKDLKGLCTYGDKSNLFIWGVENGQVNLYKVEKNTRTLLYSAKTNEPDIHLQIESINGRTFRFQWSGDGKTWEAFKPGNESIDGIFLPQWGRGVRAGLFLDKNQDEKADFSYFMMKYTY